MINTGVDVESLDAHNSVLGSYISLAATKSVPLILKRSRIYSCIRDLLLAVRILSVVHIACLPHVQMVVDTRYKNKMKGKQMVLVCWIKNTTIFKVIEQMIVNIDNTIKYIPPQPFNPLIMNTAPGYHTSSSQPPIWMLQHEHWHSNIFTPFIWPHTCGKSILFYSL